MQCNLTMSRRVWVRVENSLKCSGVRENFLWRRQYSLYSCAHATMETQQNTALRPAVMQQRQGKVCSMKTKTQAAEVMKEPCQEGRRLGRSLCTSFLCKP